MNGRPARRRGFVATAHEPLIAVLVDHDGHEEVRYYTDEEAEGRDGAGARPAPIKLAGVWSDLDADEMLDELDRMRHESKPTLPLTSI